MILVQLSTTMREKHYDETMVYEILRECNFSHQDRPGHYHGSAFSALFHLHFSMYYSNFPTKDRNFCDENLVNLAFLIKIQNRISEKTGKKILLLNGI